MAKGAFALVIAVVLVVLWQARLRRAEPSPEAAAIGAMSAITKAQATYSAVAGHSGYAASLAALAAPCPGTATAFISPDLASDPASKSGYRISLHAKPSAQRVSADCNGVATYSSYYATASPASAGDRRWRAFATDESGNIWYDTSGTAPTPPFTESATLKLLR